MKKFITFMLTALIGVVASTAQVVESKMGGVYVEKGPAPEHRWFVKFGGGLAIQGFGEDVAPWYYTKVNDLSKAKGSALDLSLGYNRDFKHGSSWYWGAKLGVGLNFLSQDYDEGTHSEDWVMCSWDSQSVNSGGIVNLHIGPTIGLRKTVGKNTKLDVNFTPEFVWTDVLDGEGAEFKDTEYYKNDDEAYHGTNVYFDDFSHFAASTTLGIDLWIKKFIVGVNYRYTFDFNDLGNGPQTVMLNVGFAF